MSLTIRPMRIRDLVQVVHLVESTEGLGFKSWENFWVLARTLIRNWGLAQVAVENGSIIGSVFIGEGLMVMVHHLSVAPQARGQNIGTRMVQAGLRGVYRKKFASRRVYVTVLPDNVGAQTFWTRFGCTLQATGDLFLYTLDLEDQPWLTRETAPAN